MVISCFLEFMRLWSIMFFWHEKRTSSALIFFIIWYHRIFFTRRYDFLILLFFCHFLYETFKLDVWRRKNKKIRLNIFLQHCQNFFYQRLWAIWFGSSLQFNATKVSFSRKGVFLNPNRRERIAQLVNKCSNIQKPTTTADSYVWDKWPSIE
jgi:hypothetical protein